MLPHIKDTFCTARSLLTTTLQNYSQFIKFACLWRHVCCLLRHQKQLMLEYMFRLRCCVCEDGTKVRKLPPDGFATSSTKRLRNSQCWEEDRRTLPKYGFAPVMWNRPHSESVHLNLYGPLRMIRPDDERKIFTLSVLHSACLGTWTRRRMG